MSIRLKLEGFDELLKDIEKAGGSINSATRECLVKSAVILQNELVVKMQAADVDGDLIKAMDQYEIETHANRYKARVGYKKGAYDPHNLSAGYKVVFLNYGTPRRKEHGQIEARGFIQKAKKAANRKIKKQQEETLQEILKGLES